MSNQNREVDKLLLNVSRRLSSADKDLNEAIGFLGEAAAIETDPARKEKIETAEREIREGKIQIVKQATVILALQQ